MSLLISKPPRPAIIYPDSDGQPMAENTQQYEWIVTIKGNLDILFLDRPDVFVAGDLLWYPVEGDPRSAPRPIPWWPSAGPRDIAGRTSSGRRGGSPPRSSSRCSRPATAPARWCEKFQFYDRYGVEEYYVYDPDTNELGGFHRERDGLKLIPEMDGWASPLLGIRFDCSGPELKIAYPDGRPFLTFTELGIRVTRPCAE